MHVADITNEFTDISRRMLASSATTPNKERADEPERAEHRVAEGRVARVAQDRASAPGVVRAVRVDEVGAGGAVDVRAQVHASVARAGGHTPVPIPRGDAAEFKASSIETTNGRERTIDYGSIERQGDP